MIVVSRARNESIVIDESITVTVVDIRGDKVRLAVDAPSQRSIHRSEVWEAIQRASGANRPQKATSFKVTSAGADGLGLAGICQRFCNEQRQRTPELSAEAVLESFKRAIAAEIALLNVKANQSAE